MNRLFGTSDTDLCYGYNAFWARWLPALQVDCDGFEVETLLNIRAAHEHDRRGTDCALCGPDACPRYRRRWSWRR